MKILFTGTSSFTGLWLIKELSSQGHTIHAVCQKSLHQYEGIRRKRLEILSSLCRLHFNCSFGEESFFDVFSAEEKWDLLCHHAAETRDFKSRVFDFVSALEHNTSHLLQTLKFLQAKGCNRIILTGSVFEPNEGGFSDAKAVSLFGLSKGLTYQVFKYFTETCGIKLGKFVIPAPFGPYDEPRYLSYLVKSWFEGKTPTVNTPAYIRDHIHVELLSKAYRIFAESLTDDPGTAFHRPSGIIETHGAFVARFAREIGTRLNIPCPLETKEQTDFPEPLIRVNTDHLKIDWNEAKAWDDLAAYYTQRT